MKKFLSALFLVMLFLCSTGCSGTISDTPSAGMATITKEESFICVVSDKHTEERTKGLRSIDGSYYEYGTETYYYVTAVRDEKTALRFRTNEDFYNLCEIGTEFLITEQVVDYPIVKTETRYCYKGQVLNGATLITKSEYTAPDLSEYEQNNGLAEFISVDSDFYRIVGFDELDNHNMIMVGKTPTTTIITQYLIIAEDSEGNRLHFETEYDFWERSALGDTLTIVAQKMKYALSGVQTNYFLNGYRLNNVEYIAKQ